MFKLNPFTGSFDYFESISTTQQVFAGDYASIQLAVDAVSAHSEATSSTGCIVWIPPGDYSASTVVCKKNISLIGISPGNVLIGTVEYRPSSNIAGPQFAVLKNLLINNLTVSTETAASSGVYFPGMLDPGPGATGLKIENCFFDTTVTLKAVASAAFTLCQFLGTVTTAITNTGSDVRFTHCNWTAGAAASITISADDTSAQKPTSLDGSVTFIHCECPPIEVSTGVSSVVAQGTCYLLLSYLNTATINANAVLLAFSTTIGVDPTVAVTGSFQSTARIGYTPSTSSDWNVPTITDVGAGLDELASRLTAIPAPSDVAYDATSWDGVTTIAPSKNAVRDEVEVLVTAIAGKEPTITAGTTAQYLRGDKSLSTFATAAKSAAVSDVAYDATSWDAVTDVAPSKNAVRDKINAMISDTAYDSTTWNGVLDVSPSKNAVRDQIETMLTSISGKEPTITAGTTAQYLRGDKSLSTFATDAKTAAVNDTAYNASSWDAVVDVAPSKNAVRDQVVLLATLSSPTLTGTPAAPTAAAGDNSTQIATTAFVTAAGTAIDNNGSYSTILQASASHIAGKAAGTYGLGVGDPAAVSGTGTLYPLQTIYIAAADYPTIGTKTTKLRIRAQLYTNDVAPTGNFTFGLYPITRPGTSGGTGVNIYTIGTVVSGSNGASFTTPAADGLLQANGSDFAIPADGHYIIAVVTTGTIATNSLVHMVASLQMRNT